LGCFGSTSTRSQGRGSVRVDLDSTAAAPHRIWPLIDMLRQAYLAELAEQIEGAAAPAEALV